MGDGALVTNAQVVIDAKSVRVRKGQETWTAWVAYHDAEHELAQLQVEGFHAPAVSLRSFSNVQVDELFYVVGAANGEVTLWKAVVTGLRGRGAGRAHAFELSGPTVKGSGGSGVFDDSGRLVGITILGRPAGEAPTSAVPVEWIVNLLAHPVPRGPSGAEPSRAAANSGPPASAVTSLLREGWDRDEAAAQQAFAKMGRDGAVELANALREGDQKIRRRAAQALGNLGPEATVASSELARAAKDPDLTLRLWAFRTLERIGKPETLLDLANNYWSNDRAVRVAAIQSLGKIGAGDANTTYLLIELLKDRDAGVRAAVEAALVQVGSEATGGDAMRMLTGVHKNASDPQIREALGRVLTKIEGRPPS